jgi:glycosyltransferase involved in cell wall biosynthesis
VRLSVVMPVYNEEAVIEQLILDLEQEVVSRVPESEVIVVDDRSTDGTGVILDRLATSRPWLRIRHAEANRGHGPSVITGLELAIGEWIFQLDSDGQFLVRDFRTLWARRLDADLVLGVRVSRRDPVHRLVLSRLVAVTVSLLARRRIQDPNVPFRLIRGELWQDVQPLLGGRALAPSILVALAAARRRWRIAEIPVTHLPRQRGSSSLRAWKLLAFSFAGLRELLAFHHRLRREPVRTPRVASEVT